ncbi:MAG: hypothetical protein HHAS10_03490 [Candidatus Altimarinota bacterium]
MKNGNFPPNDGVLRENLGRMKIGKPNPEITQVAGEAPLIHVTTLERALGIIDSGTIDSCAKSERKGRHFDRLAINTDKLDRKYGLDRYVFTTLGRNALQNGGSVSFVFRPQKLLEGRGVVASLKEVGDYGALVSQEAEFIYREVTGNDPAKMNRIAMNRFLEGLVRGADFRRVFAWFLQRNFTKYLEYLTTLTYPGEELVHNDIGSTNVWGGPQVMIPESINLDELAYIVTRTREESELILRMAEKKGLKTPTHSLEEELHLSMFDSTPGIQTSGLIQAMNILVKDLYFGGK